MSLVGQYPQLSRYETTQPSIVSLHRLEANGVATVGRDYTLVLKGGSGSYSFDYAKFDKGFTNVQNAFGSGYLFYRADNDTYLNWEVVKTWSLQFKSTSLKGQVLFGTSDGGSGIFDIHVGTDGKVVFEFNDLSTCVRLYGDNNICDGLEHNILAVNESISSHKLYIDGVLNDSSSTSLTVPLGNSISIGASAYGGGSSCLDGTLDELTVFTKAFTAKEAYAFGGGLLI